MRRYTAPEVNWIMFRRILICSLTGVLAVSALGGAGAEPADKVQICHHTSSESNPFVVIDISGNAEQKHLDLHGGTGPDEPFVNGVCGDGGPPQ